jgi:HAMP domain-containing protein
MIDIGFAELQRRDTVAAVAIADLAQTALSVMVDLADAEMRWARIDLILHAATLACAMAFVAGCLVTLRRRICRPLLAMTSTMRRLAERQISVEIPGSGRGDEIGAMASAMQVFKDSIIEALAAGQVREDADRELRTQNVRFAAALGSMSQGLGMFDAADRLVVQNLQFTTILGIPRPRVKSPGRGYRPDPCDGRAARNGRHARVRCPGAGRRATAVGEFRAHGGSWLAGDAGGHHRATAHRGQDRAHGPP